MTQDLCSAEIAAGLISTMLGQVEDFAVMTEPFDLAFACRVGALDGRHPRLYESALTCLRQALVPGGFLYLDTGDPLKRIRP